MVELTPYAATLGLAVDRIEGGVPILRVAFSDAVQGRPGALHGGAISGLLETAGYVLLRLPQPLPHSPIRRSRRSWPPSVRTGSTRSGGRWCGCGCCGSAPRSTCCSCTPTTWWVTGTAWPC